MATSTVRVAAYRMVRAGVSLALLGFVLWRFGLGKIAAGLRNADPLFIGLGVVTFIVSGAIGAVQWRTLLGFHGVRAPYRLVLARYFMGLFFNYILPGFIGGDVIRVYKTAAASGQTAQAVSSTLADRVLGLLVLVLFSLGAWAFLPGGAADAALPVGIAMFVMLAGFAAVFAWKPLGSLVNRMFGRFLPTRIGLTLRTVYEEMHRLSRAPGVLVRVFALSVCIQLTRIGVHYLCGHAVGIEAGFVWFVLFVPLVEIVASLPFSFGGVGVRETIAPLLFATAGVAAPLVVAYTLTATAAGFTGSLPGAVAFMLDTAREKPT